MYISEEKRKTFLKKLVYSDVNFWNDIPCLEWNGSLKNINSYGQIYLNGKSELTHRVAWIMENGDIPEGLLVLHHCDNRKCCNVNHLFLGTNKENSQDMVRKGRDNPRIGVLHPLSKLSESDVSEIKRLFTKDSKTYHVSFLSRKFKVHRSTIYDILNGIMWKHIT